MQISKFWASYNRWWNWQIIRALQMATDILPIIPTLGHKQCSHKQCRQSGETGNVSNLVVLYVWNRPFLGLPEICQLLPDFFQWAPFIALGVREPFNQNDMGTSAHYPSLIARALKELEKLSFERKYCFSMTSFQQSKQSHGSSLPHPLALKSQLLDGSSSAGM